MGRFLNADDISFLGATGTTAGYNLYAYCENDPVTNLDPNGFLYIKLTTLAKYVLAIVGFNPIGATLIAIGLHKAKIYITAKMALLGARLGQFWGPIVCGILTTLFALLGLGVGGQIAEALWDCAWEGKKGVEFVIKRTRWGVPYKLDIYAK